ncbi:mitoguardin-like [Littorina saxatilis]|uniref:Mitoguardin n=1 Tax=Littorina saxatilis TaxID=31220 RepID=A0AAN9AWL8_9CAEN
MFKSFAEFQRHLPAHVSQLTRFPRHVKLTALGLTLGLAVMSFMAAFFRRRRRRAQQIQKKLDAKQQQRQRHLNQRLHQRLTHTQHSTSARSGTNTPNGDITSRRSAQSTASHTGSMLEHIRQRSLSASMSSLGGASVSSSTSTITHSGLDTANMSPLELCSLGMESLSSAVSYWEDAIMKMSYLDDQPYPAIPDSDTAALQHRLENLLDVAYRMQDNYERLCERHADHVALGTALSVFAGVEDELDRRWSLDDESSDQDSFCSATDMANLADLESHREILHMVPLYETGLLQLKHGSVPCRQLRSEMAHCLSDVEFLAKLHGVRMAFEEIFMDPNNRQWFASMGRRLLGSLLIKADKDAEEFYVAYDKLLDYVDNAENWPKIEAELAARGVKVISFYDVVMDFILMDAFDDLENPPSTVTAVVNNRWLSNGFKETALATACWSVLKAKRRLLKYPDGFISHFYGVSEHTSPVLAWGFLGPDSDMKPLCLFFKDLVLGFFRDVFNFQEVRYTTVEDLAEDILLKAKEASQKVAERLCPKGEPLPS